MTMETPGVSLEAAPSASIVGEGLRPAIFYLVVAAVFVIDQLTKSAIQRSLRFEESRPLIGSAFALTLTHNSGGAWGLLPHGNVLFIAFASAAVLLLALAYHRMARTEAVVATAFALALGGAFGNLLDRLRYGYVIDFLDARIIRWPVFNLADTAITCSILLLMFHFIRSDRAIVSQPPSVPPTSPGTDEPRPTG